MIVIPAIDIMNGCCVRLVRGDYGTAYKVARDAVNTAREFEKVGAQWLHIVDLNGAIATEPVNTDLILKIIEGCGMQIEIGGGIRTMKTIDFYLSKGVSRVILGSAAINNPKLVEEAVKKYGDKIAVGIDANEGMVAAEGWTETSSVNYLELGKRMDAIGVQYIIYGYLARRHAVRAELCAVGSA